MAASGGIGRTVCTNAMARAKLIEPISSARRMSEEPWRGLPKRKQPQWWRPDPVTGTWIPEDHEGQIDTVDQREERLRSVPTASLEDRAWWSSLEDLPDRDATVTAAPSAAASQPTPPPPPSGECTS